MVLFNMGHVQVKPKKSHILSQFHKHTHALSLWRWFSLPSVSQITRTQLFKGLEALPVRSPGSASLLSYSPWSCGVFQRCSVCSLKVLVLKCSPPSCLCSVQRSVNRCAGQCESSPGFTDSWLHKPALQCQVKHTWTPPTPFNKNTCTLHNVHILFHFSFQVKSCVFKQRNDDKEALNWLLFFFLGKIQSDWWDTVEQRETVQLRSERKTLSGSERKKKSIPFFLCSLR